VAALPQRSTGAGHRPSVGTLNASVSAVVS